MKLWFLLALLPVKGITQPNFSDTARQIETILKPWSNTGLPGVSVAISRNGEMLYTGAFGSADLEHGIPIDTATIFEAGSVSKQFTAAAILLLELDGKLSLQDDVRKYIPELPKYESVIRIYDLIHHQSGLRDWGSVAEVEGWGRGSRAHTNEHALQIICRQQALNNPPGTEYIYSNSNYNLMAILVERISKKSFALFCKERIFLPAGMLNTSWRNDYRQIVKKRAIAYQQTPVSLKTLMPFENAHGNGGLLTTAADLVTWNAFMHAGKLGGAEFLQRQLEKGRFRNGVEHNYAAGLVINQWNGRPRITHSGATAGYRANLDYFPETGLSVAILSNTSGFSPVVIADKIVRLFVPDQPALKYPEPEVYKADPVVIKKQEGWYRNSRTDDAFYIRAADSTLVLPDKSSVTHTGDGSMYAMGHRLLFTGSGLTRISYGIPSDTVQFIREPAANQTAAELKAYEGTYKSTEANVVIRLKAEGEFLQYLLEPDAPVNYKATYKDGFESIGSTIRFIRDTKGKLKGFTISVGRARRIWFGKIS